MLFSVMSFSSVCIYCSAKATIELSYLDSFLFNILVEWRTLSQFPLLGGVLLNAEVLAKRNPELNKGVGITSEILVFNAWFV